MKTIYDPGQEDDGSYPWSTPQLGRDGDGVTVSWTAEEIDLAQRSPFTVDTARFVIEEARRLGVDVDQAAMVVSRFGAVALMEIGRDSVDEIFAAVGAIQEVNILAERFGVDSRPTTHEPSYPVVLLDDPPIEAVDVPPVAATCLSDSTRAWITKVGL